MRIAFMGKGGAGKTSIAAAFILHLIAKKRPTLAFDLDVNCHLSEALGMQTPDKLLGKRFDEVAKALEGGRSDYQLKFNINPIPCFGTIPSAKESHWIRIKQDDRFLRDFARTNGTLSLLAMGPHEAEDFSATCYHSKLNTAELIYHRIFDTEGDFVVADSAAGTDAIGTSLFMVHDMVVFVIEPTEQSLSVYLDYISRTASERTKVFCILNKIEDQKDTEFLRSRIAGDKILAEFGSSRELRSFEQGDLDGIKNFAQNNRASLDLIENTASQIMRDWTIYFSRQKEIYEAESLRWWNPQYQVDLRGIDWLSPNEIPAFNNSRES